MICSIFFVWLRAFLVRVRTQDPQIPAVAWRKIPVPVCCKAASENKGFKGNWSMIIDTMLWLQPHHYTIEAI